MRPSGSKRARAGSSPAPGACSGGPGRPGRPGSGNGGSGSDEEGSGARSRLTRRLRRRRLESDGGSGVERSLGFAYLRESRGSTESARKQQQHSCNNEPENKVQKKRSKQHLSSSRSSLAGPSLALAIPVDDDSIKFASPRSAVSTSRGFSHLRESLSFAVPRDISYADQRRSVTIPRITPPCPLPDSAKAIALSGSRSSLSTLTRSDRTAAGARPRRRTSPPGASLRSLHGTESPVEYQNSTGSLGEIVSSRESLRSRPATASHSMSTLGPLDLSPILREEHRPRRRHRSSHVPAANGMPIDVPASVLTNTAHNGTVGASRTRAGSVGNIRHHVARASRASLCVFLTMLFLGIWAVATAPLFMRLDHPDYVFVRDYVDSLSEVQFIYEIPQTSLKENGTEQLYLRVLSEATERVERAILPRKPPESDTKQQALYLRRMLRVYQSIQHRARLYARSRHYSRLHQYLIDPMRDVWVYGVMRHGLATTMRDLFWEPSWRRLWARVKDVAVCLRQDEKMPCPTLTYRREEQYEADGIVIEPSVVSGSRAEIENLRRQLEFVRQTSRRKNREYNHLQVEEVAGALVQ